MNEAFDAEACCDRMAAVMGLTIEPDWRQAVVDNLRTTRAMAELVLSFPLEDGIEPAPVFEP